MAFVSSPIPPEQQNQFSQSGVTTPNPLSLLPPQTGGSAGTGSVGGQQGQSSTTQFGAPASKLSDYLNANQDQTMAQGAKIAGDLTQQYNQVQGAVGQAGQNFSNQVGSSYAPYDPNTISQATQNPSQFASDPSNVQKFQAQYNDQYTGPANFESTQPYADVQGQVGKAVQNAGLLGNQSGLSNYLAQGAKGTYTPGMSTLDAALMQGNQPAFQQITDAAKPYAGLNDYLSSVAKQSNDLIPQAQASAAQAKQSAQGAVSTAATELNTKVQSALNAAQQKYGQNAQYGNIQQAINNGDALTPDQASIIGIDPATYAKELNLAKQTSSLYNNFRPNLSDYFTPGQMITTPPSAANVASPDMYSTADALQRLTGGQVQGLTLDPTQIAQAGTFNGNVKTPGLDIGKATGDISKTFSNADLASILGQGKGPIDKLTAAQRAQLLATTGSSNIGPVNYDQTFQTAAQQELPYVQQFGPGYYGVNQQWMDALNRLAGNTYQ